MQSPHLKHLLYVVYFNNRTLILVKLSSSSMYIIIVNFQTNIPLDVVISLITACVLLMMELLALTSMLYVVPGSRLVRVTFGLLEIIVRVMISPPGFSLYFI